MAKFATIRKVASLCAQSALLAMGLGLAADGAWAQETAAPANEGEPPAWLKVCSVDAQVSKNVCIVKQDLLTNTGQFLASLQLREVEGDTDRRLIAAVPPGMLIQPGLQVQVDKNKHRKLKYGICFPNACFAELPIDDEFIAELKKGGQLTLTTLSQQGKPRPFPFTLIGFTAVYDGPGLDPKQLQSQQQNLRSELEKRAEEQRKKLIDAQKKAPATNN